MVLHNPDWERKRPKFEPRGVTATELVHEKGWAKFDLLLGMSQRPTGLNTTWEYSTELFDDATAVRHRSPLREAARVDRRQIRTAPISRLPMLLDEERAAILSRLVEGAGRVPAGQARQGAVRGLGAAHARRRRGRVRGRAADVRELDERANRLAHRLRRLGVGPGTLVGIYMDEVARPRRRPCSASIKAGGAYVPLDPMYPADRIEFMLEDARADGARHRRRTSCRRLDAARTSPSSPTWDELDARVARAAADGRRRRRPRLRDLHERLDRAAEGRDDHERQPRRTRSSPTTRRTG